MTEVKAGMGVIIIMVSPELITASAIDKRVVHSNVLPLTHSRFLVFPLYCLFVKNDNVEQPYIPKFFALLSPTTLAYIGKVIKQ